MFEIKKKKLKSRIVLNFFKKNSLYFILLKFCLIKFIIESKKFQIFTKSKYCIINYLRYRFCRS